MAVRLKRLAGCPDFASPPDYLGVRAIGEALTLDKSTAKDDFARNYSLHVARVFAFVSTRVASRDEAEDVTSEIFERALRSTRSSPPRGPVDRWLFSIARHALADHYRTRNRAEPLAAASDVLADASGGPEEFALRQEQVRAVRDALADFSEEQRTVVALRLIAGLSYPDIAAVVGRPEATVKKIAYRALDRVRDRLSQGGFR